MALNKVTGKEHDLVRIRQCDQCGCRFVSLVSDSIYGWAIKPDSRKPRLIFCSYRCMRAYEKPIIKKEQARMAAKFAAAAMED